MCKQLKPVHTRTNDDKLSMWVYVTLVTAFSLRACIMHNEDQELLQQTVMHDVRPHCQH